MKGGRAAGLQELKTALWIRAPAATEIVAAAVRHFTSFSRLPFHVGGGGGKVLLNIFPTFN